MKKKIVSQIDFEVLEDRLLFSGTPIGPVQEGGEAGGEEVAEKVFEESEAVADAGSEGGGGESGEEEAVSDADLAGVVEGGDVLPADVAGMLEEGEHHVLVVEDLEAGGDLISQVLLDNEEFEFVADDTVSVSTAEIQDRLELLFVDSRLENGGALAQSMVENALGGAEYVVVTLDATKEGLGQVAAVLRSYGEEGRSVDAMHLVSHAMEGRVSIGATKLDGESFSDAGVTTALESWKPYLSEDADILLYGCDVAQGEGGARFLAELAERTGADVAASVDDTGAEARGGDWVLEATSGIVETAVLSSTMDVLLPAASDPHVTLEAPSEIKIGETVQITLKFDNTDALATGYGPWVDLFIDATGADGIVDPSDPGNAQAADTDGLANPGDKYDGLSFVGNATYLGSSLTKTIITLDDTANGGKGVLHPYAVDANGDRIYISTTDASSPYFTTLNGSYQSGDKVMVIQLPFGSFTPGQPEAEIKVGVTLSDHADTVGHPVKITAMGGFRYGDDPLNNPTSDPSILGTATSQTASVGVNLATLTKTYNGPENETATGENYTRTYRINIDVADGQTLSSLHVFDDLPEYLQFKSVTASGAFTVLGTPSTTVPGGKLSLVFDNPIVGGAGGTDAWVDVEFYVPRVYDSNGNGVIDAGDASVLSANSGADRLVSNQAYGYGTWTPIDPRDTPPVIVGLQVDTGAFDPTDATAALATAAPNAAFEHQNLEVSPLVVQKNFTVQTNTGSAGYSPGDTLEFTLDFQVSDYYAFQNLVITDTMLDGLRFDASFTPTLLINGNTYVLGALGWQAANYTVSQNFTGAVAGGNLVLDPAGNDGSTTLTFRISDEMVARGQDGKLVGGGINPGAPTGDIANDLTGYDDGATTGRIVYRAQILDRFTDTYPSGESAVNARDVLNNSATITGDVLDLGNNLAAYAGPVTSTDDSAESITIVSESVVKTIYAVNGDTDLTGYQDGNGNINLQAGDVVTYRFRYTIPSGDIENLRFTDFLPLPVYDVDDANANGVLGGIGEWSFVDNTANVAVSDFAAGHITYGPTHTLHTVTNPAAATPAITIDSVANSLRMEWGDFVNTANDPKAVDILLSVTVNSSPFADGMFLTNQVQSGEGNTQTPGTESLANAIIQIVLNQPDVSIFKGVVASTQGGAVAATGGLTFAAIGSSGFTGTLTGLGNAEAIGALDLLTPALPDTGDIVRFALVAFNKGRSDAFDVRLQDTVNGSFVNNYADTATFKASTNFEVRRGNGTLLTEGADYTLAWNAGTKTFQVELTDNYSAGNTAGDSTNGGISRGFQAAAATDVTNGSNAIIVLYDLTVDADAQSGSTVVNVAKLTNYAGKEGAEDHTAEDKTETASVAIAAPEFTKVLTGTSIVATNNSNTQAVIGEVATYTLTVTVREGVTAAAAITDTLDSGLAFVDVVSATYSAGVTSVKTIGTGANPANVAIAASAPGSANLLTFDFGDITNTNTVNATAETITIVYRAAVLNTNTLPAAPGNQANSLLNNSAELAYTFTNDSLIGDATVQAASTGNLGTAFAGNQITGVALTLGSLVIDGVTLSVGNTVLVKDQTTASQNGIYRVSAIGGTATLARVSSFDSSGEAVQKYTAFVAGGTTQGGKIYAQQTDGVVLNTSNIVWAEGRMPTDATPIAASAANLTVIEPVLTIDTRPSIDGITFSTSTVTGFDAGDTVYYRIRITNASTAPGAFDLALANAIPSTLENLTVLSTALTNAAGAAGGTISVTDGGANALDVTDFAFSGNTLGIAGTSNIDLGPDSRLEIVVSGTLTTAVTANQTITYTPSVTWTSLDGSPGVASTHNVNSVERTGADGAGTDTAKLNNYIASEGASIRTNTTINAKSIVSTDQAFTGNVGGEKVAIGEVVRYRLLVQIPEGTLTNFQIADTLPAGLLFIDDGTATVGFVSDGNTITSSVIADLALNLGAAVISPTFALPDAQVSTSATVDEDTWASGTDPRFKLGNIVNTENDANAEYIVVEFNARVVNETGNQSGTDLSNTFTTNINGTNGVGNTPAGVVVQVVEPKVQVTQSVTSATTGLDAGDSVTYSVTINNLAANGATTDAFEVSFSDVLPAGMLISSIGAPTLSGGAVVDTVLGGNGTNTLTGIFDIPLDGSVTFTFTATIPDSVAPGQTLNSDINVSFTTLDGASANERNGSGVADPESNTLENDATTLNNYAVGADTSVTAANPFSVTKSLLTTSQGGDASTNVLVGETLTFRLQVSVMEGTTSNLSIVDTLPSGLAYVAGSAVVSDANNLTVNGFAANLVGQVLTLTATSVANAGGSNATANGEAAAETDSFYITYQAKVSNILANQAGVTLTNDADATATGVTADNNNQVTVTVVEPTLTVQKSVVEASPLDAGAPLDYTIVLSNTSGRTAYDVTLSDPIDAYLVVNAGVLGVLANSSVSASGGATVSAGAFEIVDLGGGSFALRTAAGANVDIPDGESVTLTFRATISSSVQSGTTVENRANARWTSMDGAVDGERGGGDVADPAPETINQTLTTGTLNNYALSSATVSTAVNSIVASKALVTTSLGGADGVVTPGEIATYRITVTLPEGVAPDLQIRDAIPAGMAYVSGSLSFDSTGFAGTAAAPSVAPQSGVVYSDGADIVFDFASITVNPDNDAGNNSFTFTYQAVALDVVGNDGVLPGQTSLTNTAVHNDGGTDPAFGHSLGGASVTVVEPDFAVGNTLTITGTKDAGASFTYTITVSSTANATSGAYGVSLSDILPAELGSLTLASASVSDGATTTDVLANFSLVGNTLSTSTPVDLLLNTNGASDQVLTLTITGTLSSSLNPGETVSTSTSLAYTNYPGDRTSGGGFNPNSDLVTDHERAYTGTDTESFTAPVATFAKSLFATSETFTAGSNVAIGETATYALKVTLPEGTTPDLSVVDRLPTGLQYVSSSVVTTAAASGGLLAADFAGVLPAPTVGGGASDGADVSFSFGAISVTGDNAANSNSFLILVTARVLNSVGNQDAVVLQNDATFDITGDGQATWTAPAVSVTVVEPKVQVTQSATSATTGLDAGDAVTYSVTINNLAANGATADAFDVSLSDVLPAGMLISSIGVPSLSGGASVDTALGGNGTNTLTGVFDIPLDGRVTFTFTATIPDSVAPGQTLNSDINVSFTSLDGASANERGGSGVANPESNTLANDATTLNNYAVGADVDVTAVNPFSVSKSLFTTSQGGDASTDVLIGEVLTFRLQVSVMEGTTSSLSIVDTLPSGLAYVAGSAVVSDANNLTVNGFAANLAGQVLTLTATSVANPGGSNATVNGAAAAETDSFYITYQAKVSNILANQNGTTLTNDADATATGVAADNDNQVTVTVKEPRVTIDKSAAPLSGVDAGDTITYTVVLDNAAANGATSTAYDVVLSDSVPAGLLITGITSTTLAGGASTDSATAITGGGSGLSGQYDIPVGGSVTIVYTATVQTSLVPGQSLTNNANAIFTSLDGASADERGGSGTGDPADNTPPADGAVLNNYGVGDAVTISASAYAPIVQKVIASTSEAGSSGTDVLVGEVVRYQLRFELFEGTLNDLVILDSLPSGMVFLNDGTAAFSTVGVATSVTGASLAARDSATGAGVVFGDGTDVYFQLGDVVNNDNDAGVEYGVIEFNALVLNTVGNQNGVVRSNNFAVLYDADNDGGTAPTASASLRVDADGNGVPESVGQSASNTVSVTVKEAALSFSQTIPAGGGYDAGDSFSITYTITNSGAAPAYNIRLADLALPAEFNLTAISFDTTGTGGTVADSTSLAGDTIDAELSQMAAGSTWTVTATVSLRDTVNPGDVYSNPAALTFTSLPGSGGTTGNATGSDTPGAAGTSTGERTGADGVGGALNDYALEDTAGISIPTPFGVTKAADKATVTIGEVVTYTVTVTVVDGTTTNIVLNDTLPGGMTFVANSAVLTTPAGWTINGFDTNSLDQTLTSVTNPGASDATNTTGTATFTYTYQAKVSNILANQNGTTLTNDLDATATGVAADNDNQVTVTVKEPELSVVKSHDDADGVLVPGQVFTYTIVVSNTGTSAAYDAVLTDAIPAGLSYVAGSLTHVGGVAPGTLSEAGGTVTANYGSLGVGQTSTVSFRVQVTTVAPPASYDNNARVSFSSMSGVVAGERSYDPNGGTEAHDESNFSDGRQDTVRTTLGTYSLGDRVWYDKNGDGLQAGEQGISGVEVSLRYSGNDGVFGNGDDVLFTATTNASGNYSFGDLANGDYRVTVNTGTLPGGAAAVATYDLDGTGTAGQATLTMNGASRTDADFGYCGTSAIGDTVWLDFDSSGTKNGIEPGLPGVTLDLVWDADGNGIDGADPVVASTTTDASGNYSFSSLLAGSYRVVITDTSAVLANATATYDLDGTTLTPGGKATINNIGAGVTNNTADFGYRGASSIGDRVWNDRDGDGSQEAGEYGITGLGINLYRDVNGDGTLDGGDLLIATTTTGVDGAYGFSGLIGDKYLVRVNAPPASTTPTHDLDGTGTPSVTAVNLGSNQALTTADFGYQGQAKIGDFVWYDVDGDGVQDGTELPLANVRVYLDFDGSGTYGAAVDAAVLTGADGSYQFTGLIGGTYSVRVDQSTLPSGFVATYDENSGTTAPDAVTSVTVAATGDHTTADFGFFGSYELQGTVYHDIDADSTNDAGDPKLAGVTLGLYDSTGNILLATTTTNATGDYKFQNVLPGDYIIKETQPSGYSSTQIPGNQRSVTVTNATVGGLDFGEKTGSLAGTVFLDSDANGVKNGGETGIANVSVKLEWSGADEIFGNADDRTVTILTDANGDYLFDHTNTPGFGLNGTTDSGLRSTGIYRIAETQPVDYLDGQERAGNAGGAAGTVADTFGNGGRGNDGISAIQISAGQDATGYTFAEVEGNTLEGFVFVDGNSNGLKELLETPIAGVVITLTGTDDLGVAVVRTATTDAAGFYRFTGIAPSDLAGYTLTETQPTSYLDGKHHDGSFANGVTLVANVISSINIDGFGAVGNIYNFTEVVPPPPEVPKTETPVVVPSIIPTVTKTVLPETSPTSIIPGYANSMVSTYFMTNYDPVYESIADVEADSQFDAVTGVFPAFTKWELVESTPIFSSPILSGHAEPGSKVVLALYNHRGELISTSTAVADMGGNWTTGFAGLGVSGPITVTSTVSASDFVAFGSDNNFNFRTNYVTGVPGGFFQSREMSVSKAFSELSYLRLDAITSENSGIGSQNAWVKNDYEFLAQPALPGN